MTSKCLIRLCGLGVILVGGAAAPSPASAQASEGSSQASFTVDEALAGQGAQLYMQKGCMGCHSIGEGRRAGPDLLGLIDRRDIEWIRKFLTDTNAMLGSDPIAKELLEEYGYVRMPNLGLSSAEADALIHYVARETQKSKGSD